MVLLTDTVSIAGAEAIPLAVKLAYSGFMAVLVPTYLRRYGPTNFLYFCDVALLLTLAGVWLEQPLLLSMSLTGILVPQIFWLLDLGANALGWRVTGMTDYMFDRKRSLFLRGLSLFHGWLPILLVWLIFRVGYDARAFLYWSSVSVALVLVCYFLMPPPSPDHGIRPVNINYVHGMSDSEPQHWMPAWAWLAVALAGFPLLLYLPAHLLLKMVMPAA